MALEAKNRASNKPNERRPNTGVLKNVLSMNVAIVLLKVCTGIRSFRIRRTWFRISFFLINGRCGIRVKIKRKEGGMAMMKL